MILYLLKTIACSAAFYALYHFLFQREKMLVFNRFYLLGSLVVSFFIPLITFTIKVPQQNYQLITGEYGDYQPVTLNTVKYTLSDYMLMIAAVVFIIVSTVLLARFFINLYKIRKSLRGAEHIDFNQAKIILVKQDVVPYSFLNKIFINEKAYKEGRVEKRILIHELAHIQQKHSWDIIFIELLQIVYWFNPLIYLYKSAIRMNHEFLADEAVTRVTNDPLSYQQLLLQSVYVNNNIPLASSFFFTTKKRMIMLQKTFKRKRAVWAGMAAVPLLALLVYFLSSKVYASVNESEVKSSAVNDTLPSKKPTPILFKQSIEKLKESPIVAEIFNEEKGTFEAFKMKEEENFKLPSQLKNLIFRGQKGKYFEAIVFYHNNEYELRRLRNDGERAAFEKEFSIEVPETYPLLPLTPPPPKSKDFPANVKAINVRTINNVKTAEIIYKDGRKILDDITTIEQEKAFEKKYGVRLPSPPPPPASLKGAMSGVIGRNKEIITTSKNMPGDIKNITFTFQKETSSAEVKFKNGKVSKEDVSSIESFIALENK